MFYNPRGEGKIVLLCVCHRMQKRIILLRFDETKKYPVILVANTNPATQSALNKWHIGWESYLATKGFIVVGIDIRGTENQGNNLSSQVYQSLHTLL